MKKKAENNEEGKVQLLRRKIPKNTRRKNIKGEEHGMKTNIKPVKAQFPLEPLLFTFFPTKSNGWFP